MRQVLDVEAAGRDVGRDEDPDLAGLEALERPGPLRLRAVAVDRDRVDALAIEPRREPRGGELGPGEDEDLAQVVLADEVGEQRLLAVAIDRVDELADRPRRSCCGGATSTVAGSRRIVPDRRRMSSENVAENIRFWRRLREQLDDPLDVGQEAHVEHPVGLVEDEDLDLAEVGDLLADEVEQAARASRRGSRCRRGGP